MKIHNYPKSFPKTKQLDIKVNGEAVDVLKTNVAYFASVSYSEKIKVEIHTRNNISDVKISPLMLGINAIVCERKIEFELTECANLYIEIEGIELPLFFYGNVEVNESVTATYYYKSGQIYEVGEITLCDNESIYIEAGAVVKGSIRSNGAKNIKIHGSGVLDGSYFADKPNYRTILLKHSVQIIIKDIIMIEPPLWMVTLVDCANVHIEGIKQIGEVKSSDGIDIVGSHDILIENCILRNNDDCVVVKGFDWIDDTTGERHEGSQDVYNVVVQACTFVNDHVGHAIEIGHELTINEVRNITFRDIDIVHVHGHGAPFSIHVGDRALVKDIVFENIRVEHFYDKLIDFRIMKSRYNVDIERGQVRNVLFKDIYVKVSQYNPGYSVSIIGGYDEEHTIEDIHFENFYLGEEKVMNANQLDLFTKNAKNITFK